MPEPDTRILSQARLTELLGNKNCPTLIDVRNEDEFAAGHISGAKNIPLEMLAPLFDKPEQAEPMIFICQSGIRSLQAVNFAALTGCEQVWSLEGGMDGVPYN